MTSVARETTKPAPFTRNHPCPVCGGHRSLPTGKGVRCYGFLSSDGRYAHCSREGRAGGIAADRDGDTYPHRLDGPCACGVDHGTGAPALRVFARNDRLPKRRMTAAYDYRDEDGAPLFQVVRHDPKGFSQRRPDGQGGWIGNLDGVARVLYRLPELITADPEEPVIVVEGEKDADRLAALGFVATTNAGGAGKWRPGYSDRLRDRRVILIPDNDDPGRAHMRRVADVLSGVAREVRIVELPDLPEKGDVSDYLDAGGSADDLRALIEVATPDQATVARNGHRTVRFVGETFDRIAPVAIDWLWPSVIAAGHLAEVTGSPGVGKSLLTTSVAAALSTGRALPGGEPSDPVGVVMLSYEDEPGAVIRPRLETAGADLSRIFFLRGVIGEDDDARDAVLPADLDALYEAVERVGARLIIIDPILTALAASIDSHKDHEVKRGLRPLTTFAQGTGVAVLAVRHPSKTSGGRAINRPGGSIGLTGTAHLSSLLTVDPDDPERRILTPIKSNLGVLHHAWAFRIVSEDGSPCIAWDAAPRDLTADDLIAAELADTDERSALAEVSAWLAEAVSMGPRPVRELKAEARDAGFSERTVVRAKSRLGLKASKFGFGYEGQWTWGKPDHELPG